MPFAERQDMVIAPPIQLTDLYLTKNSKIQNMSANGPPLCNIPIHKGLERPHLIGLAGAGFNHALTTTKASAPCVVKARQDDNIKGKCSPGSLGANPGRTQLDRAALLLHSHQKDMSPLICKMLQSGKYYFTFFNRHRNKAYQR